MKNKAILGNVGDFEIRLIRIFKTVADAGGFSAAELELNINRSTISRHIKDLEDRLKLTLCVRGRSGFSLTKEGEKVYASAESLLEAIDEFREDVKTLNQALEGTFRLATLSQMAFNNKFDLPLVIRKFTEIAPNVEIENFTSTSNFIERAVLEGSYDVGIINSARRSNSLEYTELFNDHISLYCGKGNPLFSMKKKDMTKEMILEQKYAGFPFSSDNLKNANKFKLKRAAAALDQEGLALLTLSGTYIALLSDHYAAPFVKSGRMRKIGDQFGLNYAVEFCAINRVEPKPSRICAQFLECLR